MTKQELKKAIKEMMKNYKFTLEQSIWSFHKMNPNYSMLISEVDLELTQDQMMGRL